MKLHLGCGHNLLPGWRNIDGWPIQGAETWDLTQGLPKDIRPDSVSAIFTEHFMEHIDRDSAVTLLRSCHRALKPGAHMRITVPDLEHLVRKYVAKDLDWGGPGGWQPATPARMMNEGMRAWGHLFLYDWDELVLTIKEAGFSNFTRAEPSKSDRPELDGLDSRRDPGDLRIEIWK